MTYLGKDYGPMYITGGGRYRNVYWIIHYYQLGWQYTENATTSGIFMSGGYIEIGKNNAHDDWIRTSAGEIYFKSSRGLVIEGRMDHITTRVAKH